MNPKVSVIVPVYKAELYLAKCVDSLLAQTYQQIEIILVDDGSPDNCGKICDDYAQKDGRICVIHKENGGVADARNAGLSCATGEYIAFVDADDFVDTCYIQALHSLTLKHNCDIVQCGYERLYPGDLPKIHSYENATVTVHTNLEHLKSLHAPGPGQASLLWGKLYQKLLFSDIWFPIGKIYEDSFIVHELYYRANKIVCMDAPMYKYMMSEGSITRSPFSLHTLDDLEALEVRLDFYLSKNLDELYERALPAYCFKLLTMIHNCNKYISDSKGIVSKMKKKLRQSYAKLRRSRYVSLSKKLLYTAYCYLPYFYQLRSAQLERSVKKS